MSTFSNTAREVEMPNGDIVKLHDAVTPNSTSNIKKFKYDDNGHVTESEAANATDLNLNSYATPTSGTTAIGTSDNVQTAIGKLDHQSHIDQTNILSVKDMVCDDAFSTSKSYAVGDITIYDNKLYKFKNAHQGAWSASDVDQISLSEQNSDLTYLEAEDRAALAEVVDSGAKNKLDCNVSTLTPLNTYGSWSGSTYSINSGTTSFVVNSNLTITASKSDTGTARSMTFANYADGSVLNGMVISGGTSNVTIIVQKNGGNYETYATSEGDGALISGIAANTAVRIVASIASAVTCSNVVIKPMLCTKAAFGVSQKFVPFGNDPFYQVPINHNMIYRGKNLGDTLTDAQHTALSGGNFTDLYLGDYWTKKVTITAGTYTGGDGKEVTVPAQTNITLKAVIADFDTFYAGYASSYAGINTHHAAVIVTGFSNVVWNGTNSTAGGYVNSLIHKWLVGSVLPQIETWFGSAKVLSHQKLLTNAITGDAASGWNWSSQKISLLSENQMYGSKVWGNSKASNGGYEPGEAFKHLNVFNHIDANLLFGNKNIWLRDIASAVWVARLGSFGDADRSDASNSWLAPAALILLS